MKIDGTVIDYPVLLFLSCRGRTVCGDRKTNEIVVAIASSFKPSVNGLFGTELKIVEI